MVVELVDELVAVLALPNDLQLPVRRLSVHVLAQAAQTDLSEVHRQVFHLHVALAHQLLDGLIEATAEPVVQPLSNADLDLELVALDLGRRSSRCDEPGLEGLEPEEQVEQAGHDE